MKLASLVIRAPHSWEDKDVGYHGEIKFTSQSGEVTLKLGNDTSNRLLAVVADLVVEAGKSVAIELTAETITAAGPALTHETDA